MRRLVVRTSFIAVAGLLVLLAALVVGRHWVAEKVIIWQIKSQGFETAAADVRVLEYDGALIADVRVGDAAEIARLKVTRTGWDPKSWVYEVETVRLAATYRAESLNIGPFKGLNSAPNRNSDTAPVPVPKLPHLSVRGFHLVLDLDDGAIKLHLPGDISIRPDEPIRIDSAFAIDHPALITSGVVRSTATVEGTATVHARIDRLTLTDTQATGVPALQAQSIEASAEIQPDFAELRFHGRIPELGIEAAVNLLAAAPFNAPVIEGTGYVLADDLKAIRALAPALPDASGAIRAGFSIGGVVDLLHPQAVSKPLSAFQGDLDLQASGELSDIVGIAGSADFEVDARIMAEAGNPPSVHFDSARMALRKIDPALIPPEIGPGGITRLIDDEIIVSVHPDSRINRFDTAALTGSAALSARFDGGIDVISTASASLTVAGGIVEADGISATRIDVHLDKLRAGRNMLDKVQITGAGSLSATAAFDGTLVAEADAWADGDVRARNLTMTMPIRLRSEDGTGQISITDGRIGFGRASFDGIRMTLPGDALMRLNAKATTGSCTISECAPALKTLNARMAISAVDVSGDDIGDVSLASLTGGMKLSGFGRPGGPLASATVTVDQLDSALFGSTGPLTMSGQSRVPVGTLDIDISAENIRAASPGEIKIPALALSGAITGSTARPLFNGHVTVQESSLPPISVQADPDRMSATLEPTSVSNIASIPVVAELLPDSLGESTGTIGLKAEYGLSRKVTRLQIDIANAGGATESATISGINSSIILASLQPLLTDGPQTISIDRIDAGIGIDNTQMTFDLNEDNTGVSARVRQLEGQMFDGRFAFDPVTIGSNASLPRLTLRLESMSLVQISALLGFQDFSLSGQFEGAIPFEIDDRNRIAIYDGRLTTPEAGVMQLRLDSVGELLEQQMADQADLFLKALHNFHYSRLQAEIDKPFDGNEETLIRLEGSNPDHLDGQPFVFNINVNSNVIRLADTIFGLYRSTLGEIEGLVKDLNKE